MVCVCLEQFKLFKEADHWQQKWLAAAKGWTRLVGICGRVGKEKRGIWSRNRHGCGTVPTRARNPAEQTARVFDNYLPISAACLLDQKKYRQRQTTFDSGLRRPQGPRRQMPPLYKLHRIPRGWPADRPARGLGPSGKAAEWRTKLLNPNVARRTRDSACHPWCFRRLGKRPRSLSFSRQIHISTGIIPKRSGQKPRVLLSSRRSLSALSRCADSPSLPANNRNASLKGTP